MLIKMWHLATSRSIFVDFLKNSVHRFIRGKLERKSNCVNIFSTRNDILLRVFYAQMVMIFNETITLRYDTFFFESIPISVNV